MIRALFTKLGDRDGNFRQQLQTSGFDPRVWELCLFAYLEEAGFELDRRYATPDFVVSRGVASLAIEATTANLSAGDDPAEYLPESVDTILEHLTQRLPIKLGSPLYSKLTKRYWELPQVVGRPLIFAIESFAGGQSLWFSESSLVSYLYGSRSVAWHLADGSLRVVPVPLDEHHHGPKRIPSGFFATPDAEHVSAVIFSNSGTVAKLNRMGAQSRVGCEAITRMFRVGLAYDHAPDAAVPKLFHYQIGEHQETWGEGLSVIHNPRALFPVDESLFPGTAQYFADGETIYAHMPAFHPFGSVTYTFLRSDDDGPREPA